MSFDKKKYQRAYMRKKREKNLSGGVSGYTGEQRQDQSGERLSAKPGLPSPAQNNLPVPVLAEPLQASDVEPGNTTHTRSGEARHSTWNNEGIRTSVVAAGKTPTYDKNKYPNRKAWEIAVQRVERVVCWAKKFPERIGPEDLKFQTLDWQYVNEGLKAPTS